MIQNTVKNISFISICKDSKRKYKQRWVSIYQTSLLLFGRPNVSELYLWLGFKLQSGIGAFEDLEPTTVFVWNHRPLSNQTGSWTNHF